MFPADAFKPQIGPPWRPRAGILCLCISLSSSTYERRFETPFFFPHFAVMTNPAVAQYVILWAIHHTKFHSATTIDMGLCSLALQLTASFWESQSLSSISTTSHTKGLYILQSLLLLERTDSVVGTGSGSKYSSVANQFAG